MAAALVPPVEPHTVAHIEPLRGQAQVGLLQLQQQMIVVVHEHKGVQPDPEALDQFAQQLTKMLSVAVIAINGALLVAAGRYVVPPAGSLDPQGSGHAVSLAKVMLAVNCRMSRSDPKLSCFNLYGTRMISCPA